MKVNFGVRNKSGNYSECLGSINVDILNTRESAMKIAEKYIEMKKNTDIYGFWSWFEIESEDKDISHLRLEVDWILDNVFARKPTDAVS